MTYEQFLADGAQTEISLDLLLETGVLHQQSMRLNEAESCYRAILSRDGNNADAHHLLGLVAYQTGHHQSAATLIQKALVLDPANPSMMINLAIVFNAGQQWEEAEQLCRLGLREQAEDPELLHQLAQALAGLEQYDDARSTYEAALALNPRDVNILNNFATLLIRLTDYGEAVRHLEQAVQADNGFAMGFANLGSARRNLGDLDGAEAACREALRLEPQNPQALNNLGNVAKDRGDNLRAIEMFQRSLALAPELLEALVNLGSVYGLEGRTDESIEALENALALNPNLAATHNALGLTHLEAGNLDAANSEFKAAIGLDPNCVDAYYNLARSSASEFDEETVARLKALLASLTCPSDEAISLNFALAEIQKKFGRHEDAFSYAERGNLLRGRQFTESGHLYVQAEQDRLSARYLQRFPEAVQSCLRSSASASELPVFILGVPRSGTTLVEQIIAAHPQAHGAGELPFVAETAAALCALGSGAEFPDCLGSITPEEFRDAASGYLSRIAAIRPGNSRIIDKSPFNHRYLGLLSSLFPRAHFIYCHRDERDVGLSCYFQNFSAPLPWSTDLLDIGHYIRGYNLVMEHWGEELGSRIHKVSYERLVADPESEIRDLIDAVDLPWDDRCLNFEKSKNLVQTASKWQVRQAVYSHSVGQWRHYEAQLAPLFEALQGSSVDEVG